MSSIRIWALRIGLLLPAVLVSALAIPRFISGLALEAAYPVPPYIAKNVILPRKTYAAAAEVLSHADPRDGETQIVRAEAAHLAGEPDATVLPIIENGLSHDPASARGWTLLCEVLQRTDRARSAKALIIALELARYDYFLAGRRARDGAVLWDAIAPDDRSLVLRQAQLLWTEPQLHSEILPLLSAPSGAALMTRALSDDPQQIRKLNRWVARRRLGLPEQN